MRASTRSSYDVGVSKRAIVVLLLAALASTASLLLPPLRDGVRLAKKGAWDPEGRELFVERSDRGRSLPGPGAYELRRGDVLFLDRLEDTRRGSFFGRRFHRGAARVDGVLWPAYRGQYVCKQVAVATQVVIWLLASTLVCFVGWRANRRVGPTLANARTPGQAWWSNWRRGMAVSGGSLLLAKTVLGFASLAETYVLLVPLLLTALVLALTGAFGLVVGSILVPVRWVQARDQTTAA